MTRNRDMLERSIRQGPGPVWAFVLAGQHYVCNKCMVMRWATNELEAGTMPSAFKGWQQLYAENLSIYQTSIALPAPPPPADYEPCAACNFRHEERLARVFAGPLVFAAVMLRDLHLAGIVEVKMAVDPNFPVRFVGDTFDGWAMPCRGPPGWT